MNRTKLPIRERIGNVLQFPIGVDVAVAEGNDDHLRLHSNFKIYWDCIEANPLPQPIQDAIREAGFMGVLQIGSMRHDAGLILDFLDRWYPETHTFHLHFGEATVTLENVYYSLRPSQMFAFGWGAEFKKNDKGHPKKESVNKWEGRREYILGLRSVGRPALPIPGDTCALSLHELLGVAPDPQQDTDVIKKGKIKISWLVHHFGDCSRLHSANGHDHERELLYHTRAHLLMLIGSTVLNYIGYYMPLNLLPFVRHVGALSMHTVGAIKHTAYFMHTIRNIATMLLTQYIWLPVDGPIGWGQRGWPFQFDRVRELWEPRHSVVLGPTSYIRTRRPMCVVQYPQWYDRVARHFMINPGIWRDQQGFQGSQGYLPMAAEGFSAAYHQIRGSGVAEDDDTVDEALQGLYGTLDAIGFTSLLQRPPHPPLATPRTRVAHARRPCTAFLHVAPAPQDG
ncbi:hypothetical protein AgCh_031990 [Apium graveolens]